MKKSILIFAAIVMMAFISSAVSAQTSDTKSNQANATILGPIALTSVLPLEFGGMTVTSSLGTAIMTPASGLSKTGGVTLVTTTVTPSAASYTVLGTGLASYSITIPTVSFDVTNTSDPGPVHATMAVTDMNCSYPSLTSTLDGAGTDAFTVGGTLHVGASQVPGVYTANFNVTVAY